MTVFRCAGPTIALDAAAAAEDWVFAKPHQAHPDLVGAVAVVTIVGPLCHHEDARFDSYDAITRRAQEAFGGEARAVLFSADTPGGDLSGLFDTARELRKLADTAGKPFFWYADGGSLSAGYALAASADRIIVPAEGRLGSIGVYTSRTDERIRELMQGRTTELFASGVRKLDCHPLTELTDDERKSLAEHVAREAAIFFAWVAERRPLTAGAVQALQGNTFHGAQALNLGLADYVGGYSGALAMVAAAAEQGAPQGAESMGNEAMAKNKLEEARKLLGEVAAEDGEDGDAARKMLGIKAKKAEGDEDGDEKKDKPEGDEDKGEDEEASSAEDSEDDSAEDESDDDSAEDESDDDSAEDESEGKRKGEAAKKAKALAQAKSLAKAGIGAVAKVLAENAARTKAVARELDQIRRAQIMGTRRDLTKDQRKAASFVKTAQLRDFLACIPRVAKPTVKTLAAAVQSGVRATAGEPKPAEKKDELDAEEKKRLDRAFGKYVDQARGIVTQGLVDEIHAVTPDEARKALAALKGAK